MVLSHTMSFIEEVLLVGALGVAFIGAAVWRSAAKSDSVGNKAARNVEIVGGRSAASELAAGLPLRRFRTACVNVPSEAQKENEVPATIQGGVGKKLEY